MGGPPSAPGEGPVPATGAFSADTEIQGASVLLVSAGSGRLGSPHLGIHSALRGTVLMPVRASWPLPAPESCRRSRLHLSGHLLVGEHPGHTPFWLSEGTKESTLTYPASILPSPRRLAAPSPPQSTPCTPLSISSSVPRELRPAAGSTLNPTIPKRTPVFSEFPHARLWTRNSHGVCSARRW